MTTLFSGINLALQALMSHQATLHIVEQNVANVNTRGYHRQEAVLSAGYPYPRAGFMRGLIDGQYGRGVFVDRIKRFNVEFFNNRYRGEVSSASGWNIRGNVLSQVEATMAENSDAGLISELDAFWEGWGALSGDPANLALRADLHSRAQSLTGAINRRAEQLMAIREDQNLSIQGRVGEINQVAERVAQLNSEITSAIGVGYQPNDLLDERDRLLDRLSELSGAVSSVQDNGEVLVSIGGHALVVGQENFELQTEADPSNSGLFRVVWEDGQDLRATSGELEGLLGARDGEIVDQLTGLDELAQSLITRVNTLHSGGVGLNNSTGLDFFTGTDALSLRLASSLDDLENIAAAAGPDSPGDGSVALQIANIQSELLMNGGTATVNDFYTNQITSLGLSLQTANDKAAARGIVASALAQQREAVVGVSLDEEAVNLAKAQKAYEAAARVMTTVDQMIDTVINGMGVVGR